MQRIPRLTCRAQLINLWRTGPACARVGPSTSATEGSELSTRLVELKIHSSSFHTDFRTTACKTRASCGSAGGVTINGVRGFSAAAAEEPEMSENEFHRQAEETLHFFQERIEVHASLSSQIPVRTWYTYGETPTFSVGVKPLL